MVSAMMGVSTRSCSSTERELVNQTSEEFLKEVAAKQGPGRWIKLLEDRSIEPFKKEEKSN